MSGEPERLAWLYPGDTTKYVPEGTHLKKETGRTLQDYAGCFRESSL
jgi:hypothetical protein